MNFFEIKKQLDSFEETYKDIERIAPASEVINISIRSELSGLLLVALCATYENIFKEILIDYTKLIHHDFSYFIENNYKKLNSRISIEHLEGYLKLFPGEKNKLFKSRLGWYSKNFKSDPKVSYKELLDRRHQYAHSKSCKTTIEEVILLSKDARVIIYEFHRSLTLRTA